MILMETIQMMLLEEIGGKVTINMFSWGYK